MSVIQNIDESVIDVFAKAKSSVERHCIEIRRLASSDISRDRFTEEFLFHMAGVYAATGASFWWRSSDQHDFCRLADFKYTSLGLTGPYLEPHNRLLRFAFDKSIPFIVRPNSAPAPGTGVSNPTDSFIVFGPIEHDGQVVGLVELFLGPKPVRGKTDKVRAGYLRFMEHATSWARQFFSQQAAVRVATEPSGSFALAKERLAIIEGKVSSLREAVRQTIEQAVGGFAGMNLGSLADNRALLKQISDLLDVNGLRIACPECGTAAIVRCQRSKNSQSGVFVFDHYLKSRRTFHGGQTVLPDLSVVQKLPRRQRIDLDTIHRTKS